MVTFSPGEQHPRAQEGMQALEIIMKVRKFDFTFIKFSKLIEFIFRSNSLPFINISIEAFKVDVHSSSVRIARST